MAEPVDHVAQFSKLTEKNQKFLYVLKVLKDRGEITQDQSTNLKGMMGRGETQIVFVTNQLTNDIVLDNAIYYVKELLNSLDNDQNVAEDYSPITREKINNPNEDEQYSPLGNVLMHRKRKGDEKRESQQQMEGFKMTMQME